LKKHFTPTPLCDINGVKYDVKRHGCPCDFTPNVIFLCDFTPNPDFNNTPFSPIFQHHFNYIFSNISAAV
jgi:hypothetical protein